MRHLQGELVAMQEWVEATGAKICIVFEGLDSAGKGGTIRRITEPRKIWKLSPTDLKSYSRHFEYCKARDAMFAATDTSWAPWFVVDNDDKKRGRLYIISTCCPRFRIPPFHASTSRCR